MSKLYFLVGEDSGDLHASNLIKELRRRVPELDIRGMGGDKMQAQDVKLSAHVKDINFMGFWEVITHLGRIKKLFKKVKSDIQSWRPDAVILVDYPGFNLRMAPFIKALGISVIYYISPQLWAWKKGRIKTIQTEVDRMMVILPFEKDFYEKESVKVDFVGHPLLDVVKFNASSSENLAQSKPIIALLPGSRKQEIKRMLPVMLTVADHFPQYEFIVAGAPSRDEAFYHKIMAASSAKLWIDKTYELLQKADSALVTSGTATLETALHNTPEVVCYKGSWISYQIGKRLVDVKYISLVNLILNREVVTELIQSDFTAKRLEAELRLLIKKSKRDQMLSDFAELRKMLGDKGASARAAEIVAEYL